MAIVIAYISMEMFNDHPGQFMWRTFAEDIHQVTGMYDCKKKGQEDK